MDKDLDAVLDRLDAVYGLERSTEAETICELVGLLRWSDKRMNELEAALRPYVESEFTTWEDFFRAEKALKVQP